MKRPRLFSWNRPLHTESESMPAEPVVPKVSRRRKYLPWCGAAAAVAVAVATFAASRTEGRPAGDRVTAAAEAIDFQETADAYTVSLSGTADSHLALRREGSRLVVMREPASGGPVQEYRFDVPKAAANARVSAQREGSRIVLTIPKAAANVAQAAPMPRDPRQMMLAHFDRMRQEMDRMMAMSAPAAGLMGPALSMGGLEEEMVNVEEQADKFVVHLKVPKDQQENVKVTVDDDRVLKITANQEESSAGFSQTSHFTQVLTLPARVQSDKMSMTAGEQDMLITLPKA